MSQFLTACRLFVGITVLSVTCAVLMYKVLQFLKQEPKPEPEPEPEPEPKPDLSKEAVIFKTKLLKSICNVEDYICMKKISDESKAKIVRGLVDGIPAALADAIQKDNEEFTLCYPHIYSVDVSSGDKERVFKMILPDLCKALDNLNVPYEAAHTIVRFNVKKLKKFTNYDKMKAFQ